MAGVQIGNRSNTGSALQISQVRWRRAEKTDVGFSYTENGLASGFYEVAPFTSLKVITRHRYLDAVTKRASKSPSKISRIQISEIWRNVLRGEEHCEVQNKSGSEVENKIEPNSKQQVESKTQACVEDQESGICDINAGPPPDYSNTTPSAQPQPRTPSPPTSPSFPPAFS